VRRPWSHLTPDRRQWWAWLGAIMAVGLAIRVAFVLFVQSGITQLQGDAGWYHFQARLVSEGKGFLNPIYYFGNGESVPGADHPPGFVLILAALDTIGIDSPQGQRLVMCLVGTVSILVIGLLGRRLASPRVGLIAAALAAVYPNIWINDGMLLTETVFILATAVSLLYCYRYLERPGLDAVAIISVALTVAAMVRPEATLLFVLLLTPLVLTRRSIGWSRRILQLGVAALIPLISFAPWVLYNLDRFEEPVLISSGLGQTLLVGNCDLTYTGMNLGFWDFNCLGEPVDLATTPGGISALDGEYRRAALEYMSNNQSRLPKVAAARVGRLWGVYRSGQSVFLDGVIEGRAGGTGNQNLQIAREALWSYYVLGAAGMLGLVLLIRRRVTVLPLLAQALMITVIAALTFGLTRYRAGFEVSIVVLAAVGLSWLYTRVGGPPDETVRGPIGTAVAPAGTPGDDAPPADEPSVDDERSADGTSDVGART